MELEVIILSEIRQRQVPCDLTYMWNLNNNNNNNNKTKLINTQNGLVVAKGREQGWAKQAKGIKQGKTSSYKLNKS